MASAFNKFNFFVEDLGKKIHNLNADVLKIMLTNSAPVATNHVLADLTEITAHNGYSAGGVTPTNSGCVQTAGVDKLVLQDVTLTASGGTIGPFRYAVLYNSTPAAGNLIGWYDYGSSITLQDGESFVIDLDQTDGVLTIT
jgi:hypothetical protein